MGPRSPCIKEPQGERCRDAYSYNMMYYIERALSERVGLSKVKRVSLCSDCCHCQLMTTASVHTFLKLGKNKGCRFSVANEMLRSAEVVITSLPSRFRDLILPTMVLELAQFMVTRKKWWSAPMIPQTPRMTGRLTSTRVCL